MIRRRSLCRIFIGVGRGVRLNLVLRGIGRRLCMGGMIGMEIIIVVAQGQSLETTIDILASDQVLAQEKTIHIDLADPTLEIDIHLDMMSDIAQDQDQEIGDHLHVEMIENTSVTTAHPLRISLPSHLNGIKTSHHQ